MSRGHDCSSNAAGYAQMPCTVAPPRPPPGDPGRPGRDSCCADTEERPVGTCPPSPLHSAAKTGLCTPQDKVVPRQRPTQINPSQASQPPGERPQHSPFLCLLSLARPRHGVEAADPGRHLGLARLANRAVASRESAPGLSPPGPGRSWLTPLHPASQSLPSLPEAVPEASGTRPAGARARRRFPEPACSA